MWGSRGQALSSEQRCPPPSPAGPPPVLMGPFSAWPEEMVPGSSCLPCVSLPSSGISRRREVRRGALALVAFPLLPVDSLPAPSSFLAHGSWSWGEGRLIPSRFEPGEELGFLEDWKQEEEAKEGCPYVPFLPHRLSPSGASISRSETRPPSSAHP